MQINQKYLHHMVYLALLTGIAISLSLLERFFPMSFIAPGIKLGLSNSISLICIYLYGFREAMIVFFFRVVIVSFLFSGFSAFIYAFTGGLLSVIAMYAFLTFFKRVISPIGISIIGAFFHNLGQILVLGFVSKDFFIAIQWFPILAYASILTGGVIGIIASNIIDRTIISHLKK